MFEKLLYIEQRQYRLTYIFAQKMDAFAQEKKVG